MEGALPCTRICDCPLARIMIDRSLDGAAGSDVNADVFIRPAAYELPLLLAEIRPSKSTESAPDVIAVRRRALSSLL